MALGLYTTFTLDMVPGGAPPIIHVSAGDVGRKFTANLTYNGAPYDIQGNRVTIRGTKPDNTVFEYPVDDFERDDSRVDFIIEEQMAIVSGKVLCELREYLNDDQIGSANFVIDVETAVYDPEAASESYIPSIREALENVADDIADLATAAAINDVKQYSDAASESATAAAASATSAAESAENAFSGTPEGYAALVNTVNTLNSNQTGFLSYELEQGTYTDDANWPSKISNTKRARFKDLVAVPSRTFHVSVPEGFQLCWFSFDINFNFVEEHYWYASGEWSFKLLNNGIFVACVFKKDDNTNVTPSEVTGFRIKEVPAVETYSAYEFTQLGGTAPTTYGVVVCLGASRPWLKRTQGDYFLYIASTGLAIYRGYIAANDTAIAWRND